MKSVMSHSFSQVPQAKMPRSSFNRSHGVKTAFDAGYLVPIFVDEVLPGDTFNMRTTCVGRLATLLYPLMDNMYMDVHYFAVPLRLVWDNFQRMMGEQDNPTDSTDFTVPRINFNTATTVGDLFDHMGIPPGLQPPDVSALFFRAYNLIWNQWYRDENLQNSVFFTKQDASEDNTNYVLLKRGKRHDYFTSCLPWPQKGIAVDIPIGLDAPITGIGTQGGFASAAHSVIYETDGAGATGYQGWKEAASPAAGTATFVIEEDPNNAGYPNIRADLSQATAATINQLRQAFQVQKMYERDARGGTRYTELVLSHFGVVSPDMRLQRPEYLGGTSAQVKSHLVASTGWTGDASGPDPIGSLGAFGTVQVNGAGFTKSFTEHCIVLGLASVRCDLTYQQGINRMFHREDRLDFYWPALSHIGEQVVYNKEIYHQDNPGIDNGAFGYQERFAEYRYKPSEIHGKLRSQATGTLDAWHLSQEFASLPVLSNGFIEENPPVDRVIATTNQPHFIMDIYHDLRCARPMPLYGTPGLMDHF